MLQVPVYNSERGLAVAMSTNPMTCQWLKKRMLLATVLLAICACAPVTEVAYDPAAVPKEAPQAFDYTHFQTVLTDNVDQGWVDYQRLARNREPLERFVGLISVSGPQATPELFAGSAAQMCYYINAYNACVLLAVLQNYPETSAHRLDGPRLEYSIVFRVDKRRHTLQDLRDLLREASQGDVRYEFCLCSAAVGSPKLSPEVYKPAVLEQQLEQAARRALNNPALFRIDHANHEVYVWRRIMSDRDAFLTYYRGLSDQNGDDLLEMLAGFADAPMQQLLDSAHGYDIKIMPFDRDLNDLRRVESVGMR